METSDTVRNSAKAEDVIGVLLRDLIDYAGLFPPASLGMASCVANYDAYLRSEWYWLLGRFVVPAVRLNDFEKAFAGLPAQAPGTGPSNWRLSVLAGSDLVADVVRLRELHARQMNARPSDSRSDNSSFGRTAVIESVELKVASAEEIARLSGIIPEEFATYFEVPLSNCAECITAVAECGRRAKIRTGGETVDKFPASESIAEFIQLCAAANVPFKATAGLHHPLRSVHRLTSQAESPSGMMHGFINVFLAAAFLRAGMETGLAVQLLEEQSAKAFHFDTDGVDWRQHRLNRNGVAAVRQNSAVSFGSCSFTEPIEDLQALSLL